MNKYFPIIALLVIISCSPPIENKLEQNQLLPLTKNTSIPLTSQHEEKFILDNLQGIHQGDFTHINGNGYEITKFVYKKKFNIKTVEKLKKKFNIEENDPGIRKKNLPFDNIYFEAEEELIKGVINKIKIFIVSYSQNSTVLIQFNNILNSDSLFENILIKRIVNNQLPPNIFMATEIDSIRFGNRFINLGSICNWKNVRNIHCHSYGQIIWSEFRNKIRAERYLKRRIRILEELRKNELIKKELVQVQFEGIETTAQKFTLKVNLSNLSEEAAGNKLFVYFITCKVGEKYISCILNHFEDKTNPLELPPLINEVLIIN